MHIEGSARKIVRPRPVLVAGVVLLLAGCGGPDVVSFSQAEKHLTHVAMAYGDAHAKLGRAPKDADELKPFLQAFGNPEELLVSPNDGEPFVVAWGADPTQGGPTPYKSMFPILAYEKKGKGGKRAVTDIRGRPMLIPEEDFPKLTFAGRHRPSGS